MQDNLLIMKVGIKAPSTFLEVWIKVSRSKNWIINRSEDIDVYLHHWQIVLKTWRNHFVYATFLRCCFHFIGPVPIWLQRSWEIRLYSMVYRYLQIDFETGFTGPCSWLWQLWTCNCIYTCLLMAMKTCWYIFHMDLHCILGSDVCKVST